MGLTSRERVLFVVVVIVCLVGSCRFVWCRLRVDRCLRAGFGCFLFVVALLGFTSFVAVGALCGSVSGLCACFVEVGFALEGSQVTFAVIIS